MPALTIQAALSGAVERLARAGCDTPHLDAEVLLAHVLGQERTWLYIYPQATVERKLLGDFFDLVNRRERREPVAYLIGHKEFFGLEFAVNRQVLIPRPETELLVETGLAGLDIEAEVDIVEVGTGSGCIAVTLAYRLPAARLVALDASVEALAVASQNARRHQVAARVHFVAGDLLKPLSTGCPVDLIVSNPPYVSGPELAATPPEVGDYEPRLALNGGADGLAVIRQLLPQAGARLKPEGTLLVEIGSTQGRAVGQLARLYFPGAEIQIKKDLAGLDRLLVVKL